MDYRVFNALILIALSAISAGVCVEFGVGYGLIVGGCIVMALTFFMLRVVGVRAAEKKTEEQKE